ncbi:MAG: hypothetical protein SGILL_005522, partial [Bacillariaceae sp.]
MSFFSAAVLWSKMTPMPMISSWRCRYAIAYLVAGFLHEVAHLVCAALLVPSLFHSTFVDETRSSWWNMLGVLVGRTCSLPSLDDTQDWEIAMIRHVGWIVSVAWAVLVGLALVFSSARKFPTTRMGSFFTNPWLCGAVATALEAMATDLLGFSMWKKSTFLCGNFGVILMNSGWTSTTGDHGTAALDLLEKMIEVTMMRGAQTGGVVTWTHDTSNMKASPTPVRVRVVNGKRTELSPLLRQALEKKICSFPTRKIDPSVQALLGHTRFATSSKATLPGTHPHQWSAPENRRVYPLDDTNLWLSKDPKPVVQMISNFITHNGDLDFFKFQGTMHVDLLTLQKWLVKATGNPIPDPVDSAVIAGIVDIVRCAGCFALSIRFARLMACHLASPTSQSTSSYPTSSDYASLGKVYEKALPVFCQSHRTCLLRMKESPELRMAFVRFMIPRICNDVDLEVSAFSEFYRPEVKAVVDVEQPSDWSGSKYSLSEFVAKTVDSFFDNDLFHTTKYFMKNAIGSFGLVVTSSMDAKRQICIAARGQPMSVAFYPKQGIVCYGSELAAVKAGLLFENPGGNRSLDASSTASFLLSDDDMTKQCCRFDLDDLGGEVVLLDFSGTGNQPTVTTYQESFTSDNLRARITPLHKNEFLIPLTPDADDQILDDINTIPKALDLIQSQWKEGGLNRMAAWNLSRQLKKRLQAKVDGKDDGTTDVLVTGCEVSLFLSEQFASDVQKAFPKLRVQAISSNKLLGMFGQELAVPSIGFPFSDKVPQLNNSIVLICSHSGGTFGPLAISNLLQSVTSSIFVVASEFDTQIGKQLRGMFSQDKDILASRVFSTDIGVRPSEPCSLSVCATHQLLTQLFQHLSLTILNDRQFRFLTGAVITDQDLKVLERCNQENILALERIIGVTAQGKPHDSEVRKELLEAGNLWADHVLENVRAYILSFVYIVATVTAGYPIVTGVAVAFGMTADYAFYITRFVDSLIYFFLPQINITLVRLVQGRDLLHRMTARTVVIGDVPWVSQCSDAFLSKIFARSYSIAGLNVLSGNPSDHLVHRHTHRITRGTLLVCGRPDGRLTALTSAECSVNLSLNQASSIQSLGGTCESISIGHNPAKLQLTKKDIFLNTHRPKFLCEQILGTLDEEAGRRQRALAAKVINFGSEPDRKNESLFYKLFGCNAASDDMADDDQIILNRSSHSLKGAYLGLRASERSIKAQASTRTLTESGRTNSELDDLSPEKATAAKRSLEEPSNEDKILAAMIAEKNKASDLRRIFEVMDLDGNGTIDLDEFIDAYTQVKPGLSTAEITKLFREADLDGNGVLDFEEFEASMKLEGADVIRKLYHQTHRDDKGRLFVEPSTEEFFGATLYHAAKPGISAFDQAHSQMFSMELYESRIASLQRFVA